MMETIKVSQGDAPVLKFRFQERLPDGTRQPYILTGATVQMIGKVDRSDAATEFVYSGTILNDGAGVGASYSEVSFSTQASHTADVRTLFAKIVAVVGGAPDTLKKFWFEVEDT